MTRIVIFRLLETYFRHRWLYLLPIVMMTALGGLYIYTAKPKYQAQGILFVQTENLLSSLNAVSNNASWWVTPAQAVSNDLNEIIQTNSFIRAIIRDTDLESEMTKGSDVVQEILDNTRDAIWSHPIGNNQVVVSAAHEDPLLAYQLVGTTIEGYIQWKVNSQRSESESAKSFFSDITVRYEADLEAARDELRQYLIAHPEPIRGDRSSAEQIDIVRLQSTIDFFAQRYSSALAKEEEAQLSMAQIESNARQNYMLIDAPTLPGSADFSMKDIAVKLAVFVGVGLLGFAVAVAGAAVVDRSFLFPFDVEKQLHLPVLATIPDTTPHRRLSLRRRTIDNSEAVMVEPLAEVEPRSLPDTPKGRANKMLKPSI